jgi:hypothetical protein
MAHNTSPFAAIGTASKRTNPIRFASFRIPTTAMPLDDDITHISYTDTITGDVTTLNVMYEDAKTGSRYSCFNYVTKATRNSFKLFFERISNAAFGQRSKRKVPLPACPVRPALLSILDHSNS